MEPPCQVPELTLGQGGVQDSPGSAEEKCPCLGDRNCSPGGPAGEGASAPLVSGPCL